MTKLLVLGFLLMTLIVSGQFTLEHEYTIGAIRRINLEYSGEKYVELDEDTNKLIFYNADHSYWKSITMYVPPGATFLYYSHISEALINSDANIELDYRYSTGPNPTTYYSRIISEDGSELLSIVDAALLNNSSRVQYLHRN